MILAALAIDAVEGTVYLLTLSKAEPPPKNRFPAQIAAGCEAQ